MLVSFAGSPTGSGERNSWAPSQGSSQLRREKELPIRHSGPILYRSLLWKVCTYLLTCLSMLRKWICIYVWVHSMTTWTQSAFFDHLPLLVHVSSFIKEWNSQSSSMLADFLWRPQKFEKKNSCFHVENVWLIFSNFCGLLRISKL